MFDQSQTQIPLFQMLATKSFSTVIYAINLYLKPRMFPKLILKWYPFPWKSETFRWKRTNNNYAGSPECKFTTKRRYYIQLWHTNLNADRSYTFRNDGSTMKVRVTGYPVAHRIYRYEMKRRGLYLVTADRVRTIVDVKMIVAVQLQLVETKHEPLEDTMRLKGDGAVEVLLELRDQNSPVYFSVEIPHVVLLAHVAYLICKCIDRGIKLLEVRQLRVSFNFYQFGCVILFNQLNQLSFLILYYK